MSENHEEVAENDRLIISDMSPSKVKEQDTRYPDTVKKFINFL